MFELFAVHIDRFGSQYLLMRAVDRVLGNVASNVRSPTLQKRRTAIALIPHSRKYGHTPIEDTGFVSSIQRLVTVKVLNSQIQKLVCIEKILRLLVRE